MYNRIQDKVQTQSSANTTKFHKLNTISLPSAVFENIYFIEGKPVKIVFDKNKLIPVDS